MAEKIEWRDSYNVNIAEIDMQHKKLVAIANELYDLTVGEPAVYPNNVSKIIKKLTDYTVYHFDHEENFFRRYGYAQADFHKMQHEQFIQQINEQIRKLSQPTQADGQRLYEYLVTWLLNHIAKSDKVWAAFVLPKLK
ncbi:bacteriohemerythrin [Treponema brennaborense]|uniref:Hemerythrin-like metal-binding protein n=1 Tax=Treponema brennaborense (strain DSM 12168 / CIP 105900 / DD5/3) TaxID=906968 RepID=F4LK02_TREBD|nr:bacteriohemerythrin [Treponema brennaborense]AEE16482.1 hemerythrin-like metal-binding protein [Treponema brennaborense DSM 12168]